MVVKYFLTKFMKQTNVGFVVCYRNATEVEIEKDGYRWEESGPLYTKKGSGKVLKRFDKDELNNFLEIWGNKEVKKFEIFLPGTYLDYNGEYIPQEYGIGIYLLTE